MKWLRMKLRKWLGVEDDLDKIEKVIELSVQRTLDEVNRLSEWAEGVDDVLEEVNTVDNVQPPTDIPDTSAESVADALKRERMERKRSKAGVVQP